MTRSRIPKTTPQHERKPGRFRSREHLDWIKTLPCLACGRPPPCDPAHLRFNHADPVFKGATGSKPPDDKVVPLCREDHDAEEAGKLTFWAACMACGISDPVGVAQRLIRVTGDTERGFAAIAHARPGLPTAWLTA
jgi:hypothetical protein